jgi:MFS family permease
LLLAAPRRQQPRADSEGAAAAGLGVIGRRLRPMLAAVALTMTAEAAVGLLLLLHLQRGFDLDVVQVAYVFLPGAIAMSVAAERLHAYVVRFGRTRMLTLASVASAAFAASLAWAPNPYVVAGLWVLSGLAWALVIPIQQAVIAEASGDHAGRGMGVYESAGLLGAFAGSLAAGVLYDTVDWAAACLSAAVVILAGAVVLPWAVRRLGVADFPPPPPPAETETPAEPAAEPARPGESAASPDATPAKPADPVPQKPPRQLAEHAAVFALAQLALLLAGLSWLHAVITGDSLDVLIRGAGTASGLSGFIEGTGKIWTFILLVDVLWTATKCVAAAARRP